MTETKQETTPKREAGPDQTQSEVFLDSRVVTEGWAKLKTTLEQAIEAIPATREERDKYAESIAKLAEVFDKLPVIDAERDRIAQRLEEAGFGEDAFQILYYGYRQRVQGVLATLENVIADSVMEVGRNANPEAERDALQQTRAGLDFMVRVSEQCASPTLAENNPAMGIPLRRILTTPFETFVEEALQNIDSSATNDQLSEYSRKKWGEAVRGIQEIIKNSGCYDSQEYPWVTRADSRGSLLTEEERVQETEKPIDERDEAYYRERFQRDIEIIKKRIREREQRGENPTINTWGYDASGRQQITERRGFLGSRYEEEVGENQPKVNWFKRRVVVHEIDGEGRLKAILREVKVAWPPIFEVSEAEKGAKYGEATSERGYVRQEVRSVNTLANSPVLAWEWIQRLEAAETEERDGKTWHKIPVLRNGEACWLPLSDEDYSMWMRGFKRTLSNFERAGLDFVSTKQQQERDDLETEHRISDIGVPEVSETWFDLQLEYIAIEEALTNLDSKTPEDKKEEFEHTRAQILEFCLQMATSYGLRSEYYRIVAEVLKSLDNQSSPKDEDALAAEIIQKFELVAQSMSSLSQSLCEVLKFLEEHSELMDTAEGWESFRSITQSFLSLRKILEINGGGKHAEPETENRPETRGFGGTGITSIIPETGEERGEEEYQGLVATFDPEIVSQVAGIIEGLKAEGLSFREMRREIIKKFHPDKYQNAGEKETRTFQALMAYLEAMSRSHKK